MPRTKPKQLQQATTANGPPAEEVLTLAEAAAYLRLPEADVIAAVHAHGLPGRLFGGHWRFLKAAIQQWLSTGSSSPETRKAALLAAAGSFRDDPDLDAIVEEALRRRGRPTAEGQ